PRRRLRLRDCSHGCCPCWRRLGWADGCRLAGPVQAGGPGQPPGSLDGDAAGLPEQLPHEDLLVVDGPQGPAAARRAARRTAAAWRRVRWLVVIKITSGSEEHTSELQSLTNLLCRLLLEKKNLGHVIHSLT